MIQQSPMSVLDRSDRPSPETPPETPRQRTCDAPQPAPEPRKPPLTYLVIGAIAVLAAIFALDALRNNLKQQRDTPRPPQPQAVEPDDAALARQRLELWQTKIEPELDAAEAQTQVAIEESATALALFLIESREGSRPFAEAMLSLRGKWNLLKSKTPGFLGGDNQAHLRYLNERFSTLVFSDAELKSAIESAIVSYLGRLQAAENELLVSVRADMADIPLEVLPAARSDEVFRSEFNRIARQLAPMVAQELGVDALREVSSLVAGEIATTVLANLATRLGMSSGLMLAGVGTSWATFGLSIVAAIVIDQVICMVVDEVRDPVGDMTARINRLLGDLSQLIIEGDDEHPGLSPQLASFDDARARIRREALRRLILGEDRPSMPQTRPSSEW